MRVYALTLVCIGISMFAFRDWFRALCMLIPLVAFLERPDMPRSIMEIQGLNPFNLVLLAVLIGYVTQRGREMRLRAEAGYDSKLEKRILMLVFTWVALILWATARAYLDRGEVPRYELMAGRPFINILVDGVINTWKWFVPAYLFYQGAFTEQRRMEVFYATLAWAFCLAIQVIARMMPALIGADDMAERAARILDRDIGYQRVDMSLICAMAALASWVLTRYTTGPQKTLFYFLAAIIALGCLLTGGRAGLLALGVGGFILGLVRYRGLLITLPLIGLAALAFVPGVSDRLMESFASSEANQEIADDGNKTAVDAATSGRTIVWPYVVDKIKQSPITGFGRYAMIREGITTHPDIQPVGMTFAHPHNAYLRIVFEKGLIGTIPILLLFGLIYLRSFRLLRDREQTDPTGAVAFAMMTVWAIAILGSHSFYPYQGGLGLYSAMACVLAGYMRAPARQAALKGRLGPANADRQLPQELPQSGG